MGSNIISPDDAKVLLLEKAPEGEAGGRLHFTWSEDGKEELEKGWIVQADSLAQMIGVDTLFGRTANVTAIDDAPYYAVKIMPCMGNMQGGPVCEETE